MGIFSRFTDIINSNINALLDKAEDPQKLIRLIIQEMEDTLVDVRSNAARTIADKKQIERRIINVTHESAEWQRKAELAVSKGRDDLARAALIEVAELQRVSELLKRELEVLDEQIMKLDQDIATLKDKLVDAKSRQKAMLVRNNTLSSQLRVRDKVSDSRVEDTFSRFEHFERKLDDLEAEVESYDLGHKRSLKDQFADLEADEQIEQDLADLKARMQKAENQ